ncbi:polysaccharide deacetylase family protein [endosymbiont of Ridgeia piscesae]|jgi:peptidoglycan/xylan/chitin deacetylase (PgdA/CDA1 family)|uniref:Polysaccharide deacetylase n=1 Tax=endosymbiont of Ridgeia piscesae TaxID=54398 RepID=A0A0T5Z766_9GAMM|nr:polysaccharide deacetylase family protein [endosymbiont of Ridgeia piscesae]KRT54884.1 Polysaccharide deacetylase [endosymbiont of Ridgeia piscesae]KRT58664.1 Polysaccharide deacetylase [endosymbiont of Ridgeia piscesae]
MKIGLRVEVATLQGALEGVPRLLKLFDEYQLRASFFFSLGADRASVGGGRWFNPQQWGYRRRTASLDLPKVGLARLFTAPPVIASRAADLIRSVSAAGHEVGIACDDRLAWLADAADADAGWTRQQMDRAAKVLRDITGEAAQISAAPGWQLNPHLLAWQAGQGLRFASDTRGRSAFLPVLQGVESGVVQLPTTLPTADELIGQPGISLDNLHEFIFSESRHLLPNGHIYSLRAECEGLSQLSLMEKLLVMWKGSSDEPLTLGELYDALDLEKLPRHQVGWGEVTGRPGYLAMQSLPLE